ncbi:unnamed protein product [Chondrus crispus]|uniref:Uncharacterized protein n=1 Tax=Chondrus crispus TaxID=2769 RepID=S0F344_CHOCR|nr:unnamed protein product [Chondrus crispus]CDF77382.1 unnamed protein product [Chondrus crispus]|eukprot:XP_005712256.1 unnamed protein product [Chondrus crispus]
MYSSDTLFPGRVADFPYPNPSVAQFSPSLSRPPTAPPHRLTTRLVTVAAAASSGEQQHKILHTVFTPCGNTPADARQNRVPSHRFFSVSLQIFPTFHARRPQRTIFVCRAPWLTACRIPFAVSLPTQCARHVLRPTCRAPPHRRVALRACVTQRSIAPALAVLRRAADSQHLDVAPLNGPVRLTDLFFSESKRSNLTAIRTPCSSRPLRTRCAGYWR